MKKETQPIISIGFPVFNVEKYVERSLLSALNQDFSEPYEIVVVDDCGTDASMDIIRKIKASHRRGNIIKIINHPKNMGLGAASNTAIDNALGKYLFFLDSDDYISEKCLKKLYCKAEATNADITFGSFEMINAETKEVFYTRQYKEECVHHSHVGFWLDKYNKIPHWERWNKLYRIDFLNRNNIRTISRVMEDMYFEFRCNCCANSFSFIPDITLTYNHRPNSITSAINHSISDYWGIATVDIIIQEQKCIREEFQSVPRIYKIYYDRVLACCRHFANAPYTKEQLNLFIPQIKGFNSFIPHFWLLPRPIDWINYFIAYIHEDYKWYAYIPTIPNRVIRFIKKYSGARWAYHYMMKRGDKGIE